MVVPGVLSTMDGEYQEPTGSSPVLAVLGLSVFRPDSKVLIALAVASRGVGENAAWRLQALVRRGGGQTGTRWACEFLSSHVTV